MTAWTRPVRAGTARISAGDHLPGPVGLLAAAAVGLLWSNGAVIVAKTFGLPPVVGLAPQLLLLAAVVGRSIRRHRTLVTTPALRAVLAYGAALTASGLVALDPGPVPAAVVSFLSEGLLVWFLVVNAIDSRRDLEAALLALVAACTLAGSLSVLQFATGSYGNDYLGFATIAESRADLLESGASSLPRLAGPIGEQNRYAQILLVVVPLVLALAAHRSGRRGRLVLLSLLPIGAGIALTGSRGAVVGLVVTVALLSRLGLVRGRSLLAGAAGAAVILLILPAYRERLTSTLSAAESEQVSSLDSSSLSRITTNLAALDMFADHPVLGVGPDGFPRFYEAYAERVGINVKDEARQPHNLYLGVASQTGIVGLAAFLAAPGLLLARLGRGWRAATPARPRTAALAAGAIGAIGAYLASGVFLHLSFERYLWLLLALCDAAGRVVVHETASLETGAAHEIDLRDAHRPRTAALSGVTP